MRRVLCQVGEQRATHKLSGPGVGYDPCSHCGLERTSYEEGNRSFERPIVG